MLLFTGYISLIICYSKSYNLKDIKWYNIKLRNSTLFYSGITVEFDRLKEWYRQTHLKIRPVSLYCKKSLPYWCLLCYRLIYSIIGYLNDGHLLQTRILNYNFITPGMPFKMENWLILRFTVSISHLKISKARAGYKQRAAVFSLCNTPCTRKRICKLWMYMNFLINYWVTALYRKNCWANNLQKNSSSLQHPYYTSPSIQRIS